MKKNIPAFVYVLGIIIIFAVASLIFIEFRIKYVKAELTEFAAQNAASSAIRSGIAETVKDKKIIYSDMVSFTKDESGNIKSIECDSAKLNEISNTADRNIDKRISDTRNIPVKIPVTSFLDGEILSGIGPQITFYITINGSSSVKFNNVFTVEGINQTKHQIMLDVSADVYVIGGKSVKKYSVSSNLCVAESIIIGKTPESLAEIND